MKYYRDRNDNSVHALEDNDTDILDTWIEINENEIEVYTLPSEEEREELRVKNIDLECKNIIYTRYPIEKQSNAALGIYSDEYKQTMVSFITNIKNQCKELIKDKTKTREDFIIPEEE